MRLGSVINHNRSDYKYRCIFSFAYFVILLRLAKPLTASNEKRKVNYTNLCNLF